MAPLSKYTQRHKYLRIIATSKATFIGVCSIQRACFYGSAYKSTLLAHCLLLLKVAKMPHVIFAQCSAGFHEEWESNGPWMEVTSAS
jgi:hypothetical protein